MPHRPKSKTAQRLLCRLCHAGTLGGWQRCSSSRPKGCMKTRKGWEKWPRCCRRAAKVRVISRCSQPPPTTTASYWHLSQVEWMQTTELVHMLSEYATCCSDIPWLAGVKQSATVGYYLGVFGSRHSYPFMRRPRQKQLASTTWQSGGPFVLILSTCCQTQDGMSCQTSAPRQRTCPSP